VPGTVWGTALIQNLQVTIGAVLAPTLAAPGPAVLIDPAKFYRKDAARSSETILRQALSTVRSDPHRASRQSAARRLCADPNRH
jgi:hypothetical protein